MDRHDLEHDASLQVTVDEIITELNKQISTLNFDLMVTRLALQKLQNEFAKHTHPSSKYEKHTVDEY
jgi:uncharacterized coiled-coil protein SlyX